MIVLATRSDPNWSEFWFIISMIIREREREREV